MADVDDRAQLVLIAALVLAATLIGVALIVNTVIFTENLATRRGVDAGAATTYRDTARTGGVSALQAVNDESDAASYADRVANLSAYVSQWSNTTSRYLAFDARSGTVEVQSWTNGTRVAQDHPGTFRPADWSAFEDQNATDQLGLNPVVASNNGGNVSHNHTDWLVAADAGVRDYRLTVNESSLNTTEADDVGKITALQDDKRMFWVWIDDGTDTWNVSVYDDADRSGNVSVVVDNGTGQSAPADCTAPARSDGTVTVDLTGASITGADGTVDCEPLSFLSPDATYDIHYVDGDLVNGTYRFVADRSNVTFEGDLDGALPSGVDATDVYHDPGGGDPYDATAIYDARLDVTYWTDQLTYRSRVRLAPGEPEEGGS